ncbi:MAG: hypothetical protein R3F34_05585 [Planctomycetota bacterium]
MLALRTRARHSAVAATLLTTLFASCRSETPRAVEQECRALAPFDGPALPRDIRYVGVWFQEFGAGPTPPEEIRFSFRNAGYHGEVVDDEAFARLCSAWGGTEGEWKVSDSRTGHPQYVLGIVEEGDSEPVVVDVRTGHGATADRITRLECGDQFLDVHGGELEAALRSVIERAELRSFEELGAASDVVDAHRVVAATFHTTESTRRRLDPDVEQDLDEVVDVEDSDIDLDGTVLVPSLSEFVPPTDLVACEFVEPVDAGELALLARRVATLDGRWIEPEKVPPPDRFQTSDVWLRVERSGFEPLTVCLRGGWLRDETGRGVELTIDERHWWRRQLRFAPRGVALLPPALPEGAVHLFARDEPGGERPEGVDLDPAYGGWLGSLDPVLRHDLRFLWPEPSEGWLVGGHRLGGYPTMTLAFVDGDSGVVRYAFLWGGHQPLPRWRSAEERVLVSCEGWYAFLDQRRSKFFGETIRDRLVPPR